MQCVDPENIHIPSPWKFFHCRLITPQSWTFEKCTCWKKESHALLSLNRRIKQTTILPKWLFAERFVCCAPFVLDNNYFFADLANENLCLPTLCITISIFSWTSLPYGYVHMNTPNPSEISIDLPWGSIDIFWIHTMVFFANKALLLLC